MSLVKSNGLQVGQSVTATNNFTMYQPSSPDGTVRWGVGNSGSVTDIMTLNSSGNVGIGTSSPAGKLDVRGASAATYIIDSTGGSAVSSALYLGVPSVTTYAGLVTDYANDRLYFRHNSATRMTLDSSGNLGLGVTPKAWSASFKALQVNAQSALVTDTSDTYLSTNWYNDGSNKFIGTGYAAIYSQESGAHKWFTSTASGTAGNAITFTQAMTLDASGNLVVGATTAQDKLAVQGSGSTNIRVGSSTNASFRGFVIGADPSDSQQYGYMKMELNSGQLQIGAGFAGWGGLQTFYTNGSERMRIDSSGNVGIGTSSPNTKLHVQGGQVSDGAITYNHQLTSTAAYNASPMTGSFVSLQYNSSGSYAGMGGWAVGKENATDGNYSGYMAFFTRANAGSTTERMRIDSSGNLLVGRTAQQSAERLNVTGSAGGAVVIFNRTSDIDANLRDMVVFFRSSTSVGSITCSNSATAYNSGSDYRLKEDIKPMVGGLEKIAKLKPVTFSWKIDGESGQGFIAHELQEIFPDAVSGEKDAEDENGNPVYQGVDTSFLVATLTAAIQEQQAIIESLTKRIETLEGA